jgi:hypothetical protein
MQVTKDMVRDLLPVYMAGDACPDTRAAVEEYLEEDAELRQILESAQGYALPPLEAPAGLEQRSLDLTRTLLGRKNFWLGFALIFCAAPLFLLHLQPWWLADLVLLLGLVGWVPFLFTCRRLSATGLEPSRRWISRPLWYLIGAWLGILVQYLIQQQTGVTARWTYFLPAAISGFAGWIGEKFHQIRTAEDLARPTTLFGKQ